MARVSGGYAGPGLGTQGVVLVDGGVKEGESEGSVRGFGVKQPWPESGESISGTDCVP